ncbi:MAG: TatD family hydrolase [Gemmatimonadota bacterium]|nr:MAG: TatD family hydrolase [Gemmatimonadota bacterium]
MLVDTHCHLGDERFDEDRAEVLARARDAGVGHVVVIADSLPATLRAIELANEYGLSATAGVHPHVATSWTPQVAQAIEQATNDPTVVAVGEAGLDYYYDNSPRDVQRQVFAAQLELAARCRLPIVVHSRDADDDMVALLQDSDATVVLHSFSSGPRVLQAGLDRGCYISFSGMVTFRNWKNVEAVSAVAPDRLLVETDAPYLAPSPYRGKRNEPAFVAHVAAKVAELRDVAADELARQTTANAARCFGPRVTLQPSRART